MCLSDVYLIQENTLQSQGENDSMRASLEMAHDAAPAFKNIANVAVDADKINLTDLLGRQHCVCGTIASVDLLNNEIFIQTENQPETANSL